MKLTSLALFAVLLGAQAAHAALFDDDEARRRIEATNQRIVQMQRQLEDRLALLEQQAKSGGLADLGTQIQLLQGDLAKLRGQIEVVTYELEQSQKRQRDLYVDLDSRLRKIEASPALTTPPAASPGASDAVMPAAPAAPLRWPMFDLTEPSAIDPGATCACEKASIRLLNSTASPTLVAVPWPSIMVHSAGDSPAFRQARSTARRCPTGLGAVIPLPLPSLALPTPRTTA